MKRNNKALYENIMTSISKEVKKALNELSSETYRNAAEKQRYKLKYDNSYIDSLTGRLYKNFLDRADRFENYANTISFKEWKLKIAKFSNIVCCDAYNKIILTCKSSSWEGDIFEETYENDDRTIDEIVEKDFDGREFDDCNNFDINMTFLNVQIYCYDISQEEPIIKFDKLKVYNFGCGNWKHGYAKMEYYGDGITDDEYIYEGKKYKGALSGVINKLVNRVAWFGDYGSYEWFDDGDGPSDVIDELFNE